MAPASQQIQGPSILAQPPHPQGPIAELVHGWRVARPSGLASPPAVAKRMAPLFQQQPRHAPAEVEASRNRLLTVINHHQP